MDIQTEKLIVNAFIADRKKERVLYELSKPDKRWGCVLKLEHYIDTRFCFEIKEKISSCEQVYDILKKYKISQECYVISLDEDEMADFIYGQTKHCPYYRYYDEYKSVQKQN